VKEVKGRNLIVAVPTAACLGQLDRRTARLAAAQVRTVNRTSALATQPNRQSRRQPTPGGADPY
jgi:hypothetical protein